MVLTHAQVLGFALAAGFPRTVANTITVIANYESGDNPAARGDLTLSKYGSIGLTQDFTGAHSPSELGIGSGAWTPALVAKLDDPLINMRAARIIYGEQGFGAWSTYNNLHTTGAWLALLATVEKLTPVIPGAPAPTPPPKGMPLLGKASKNYWVARGNKDSRTAPALAFAKRAVSGPHIWHNLCLSFVRQSLGAPGLGGTALDAFNRNPSAKRHSFYAPPPGVPIFWSGGAGHVVLSGPDAGYCFSSDVRGAGTVAYVTVAEVSKWLGPSHKYLGWVESINGVAVLA